MLHKVFSQDCEPHIFITIKVLTRKNRCHSGNYEGKDNPGTSNCSSYHARYQIHSCADTTSHSKWGQIQRGETFLKRSKYKTSSRDNRARLHVPNETSNFVINISLHDPQLCHACIHYQINLFQTWRRKRRIHDNLKKLMNPWANYLTKIGTRAWYIGKVCRNRTYYHLYFCYVGRHYKKTPSCGSQLLMLAWSGTMRYMIHGDLYAFTSTQFIIIIIMTKCKTWLQAIHLRQDTHSLIMHAFLVSSLWNKMHVLIPRACLQLSHPRVIVFTFQCRLYANAPDFDSRRFVSAGRHYLIHLSKDFPSTRWYIYSVT